MTYNVQTMLRQTELSNYVQFRHFFSPEFDETRLDKFDYKNRTSRDRLKNSVSFSAKDLSFAHN